MNALNALVFAAFGTTMELLPVAFPAWFPHSGADGSSGRALWLALMGNVQIFLGAGFIARIHIAPLARRALSVVRAGEAGTLALPQSRGATSR